MVFQQTGSTGICTGIANSQVNAAPIAAGTIHTSFDNAAQRLGILVQQSGKIADRLHRSTPPQQVNGGANAAAEPTLTDKLDGLHTLISMLEENVRFIADNVG